MAFLEVKVDLNRVAAALERIADALDRAFPETRPVLPSRPAGLEALTEFDSERECDNEEQEERLRAQGLLSERDQSK